MLKLVAGSPLNQFLALGLSFANLDYLHAGPEDHYIQAKREDTGLDIDVHLTCSDRLRAIRGTQQDRTVFLIGFSTEQIAFMRADPEKTVHRFSGAQYGIPMDILVFSGETEAKMTETVAELIGPETRVTVSDRLKN